MFLLKSISNLVWKKENNEEETNVPTKLVQISGSLFRFGTNGPRPAWQCIHLRSGCVIARTEQPYQYQLNVYNEEDEIDQGDIYTIKYSLQFASDHGPSNDGISWWGTDNVRYLFEYDEELQDQMKNLFEVTLKQCVYESETKKSHEEASDDQLAQCFVYVWMCTSLVTSTNRYDRPLSSIKLPTGSAASAPSTPAKQTNNNVVPSTPVKPVTSAVNMTVEGTCALYLPADFYLFNDTANQFKPVERQVTVQIHSLTEGKNFKYMLYVFKENKALMAQEINSEMHAQFYQDKALNRRGLVWLAIQDDEHIFTWSVLFEHEHEDVKFREVFSKSLWEVNAQSSFEKNKDEDIDWIMGGYDDNVKMEEDDGIKDEDQMEFDEEQDESFEEDDDDMARDEDRRGVKNSSLAVGFTTDRSFVVRGSRLGVFKQKDSKLNFVTSIKNIKDPSSKEVFSPKKIMLHEADRSLLMLHPNNSSSVFQMDLERGQVVEEWKTDGQAIQQLVPEHKFAQVTPQRTVLAVNNTGFLAIDPRLPGSKVIKSRNFQYNAGAQSRFSCAATTEDGHMAVGSKKGTISLFSAQTLEGKAKAVEPAKPIAKTLLPGFGDPIIGIDASADGKWILATCKNYLLVAPTTFDNNGERALGFEKRMGKNKPLPRRLQLKPEHLQRVGGKVSFTPARFNISQNGEKWIATTTGPYIITWNFRKVKQNILDVYQIKKYSQTIIADEFRYNEDQSIVVAMPDDVALARRHVVPSSEK